MGEKKYQIAKILREHGLSFRQIAITLYPDEDINRAKLKVNALIRYAERRAEGRENYTSLYEELYGDENYTDLVPGERDGLRGRGPLDWGVSKERKEVLGYEEQVRLDLEQLLYRLAERVMSEEERRELFPYLRAVNNVLYKEYGKRVGSGVYPRALAYAYAVYHLALWSRASYVVVRLRELIMRMLTRRRSRERFWELVGEFISRAPPELL